MGVAGAMGLGGLYGGPATFGPGGPATMVTAPTVVGPAGAGGFFAGPFAGGPFAGALAGGVFAGGAASVLGPQFGGVVAGPQFGGLIAGPQFGDFGAMGGQMVATDFGGPSMQPPMGHVPSN
eukprot:NODE_548_length_816_cov_1108.844850_g485_i0.p2 GENE.NODE_548_length_816_cov_1108.844850_g485_i0~~NODE_548_length_816_cov_1108.844850_g485_i0.p2  ORF type:complete len:122 (-),score=48.25 NODE_548_length_816_cov_1108.844850_g485_i0:310-675(-)